MTKTNSGYRQLAVVSCITPAPVRKCNNQLINSNLNQFIKLYSFSPDEVVVVVVVAVVVVDVVAAVVVILVVDEELATRIKM